MEDDELPQGWRTARIGEICEHPQYGHTASAQHAPVGPKMLRITDIQDGRVDWPSVPYCQCDDVEKYRLKQGDILFARTGATTGKSFLVRDVTDSVFASYLIRLRVRSGILPEFLFWFFQSSQYWSGVGGGIDVGSRPNMNGSKLAELVVLFPESEAEQRRFVERVELLTGRSQKISELNASLVEDMGRLLRAEYKRITEDAPIMPFSDVAKLVRRWVKTKPDQNYPETGIRSFGKGTFHKPALTGEQLGTKRICRIKAGDLVFMNVFAWEGAIAVAQPEDDGRVASHRFMMHEVVPDQATAEFLCYYFLTEGGLEQIRGASPGSAGRNRTLGITKLEKIPVPVPPIEDQRRFAKLRKLHFQLQRLHQEAETELASFTPALLAKAFRGEL